MIDQREIDSIINRLEDMYHTVPNFYWQDTIHMAMKLIKNLRDLRMPEPNKHTCCGPIRNDWIIDEDGEYKKIRTRVCCVCNKTYSTEIEEVDEIEG
jgi:hypothetical protein